MTKMTAKYSGAVGIAHRKRIGISGDQEELYALLAKAGFWWDSQLQTWSEVSNEAADEPSNLLRVRVWAKTKDVESQARLIVRTLTSGGYRLVEQSQPYICRPPKQLESRVYLTFMRE